MVWAISRGTGGQLYPSSPIGPKKRLRLAVDAGTNTDAVADTDADAEAVTDAEANAGTDAGTEIDSPPWLPTRS